MPKSPYLGEFELHVLAALVRLGDAYGMSIRQELEQRVGRHTSIGSVYATLDRLADKGYVSFDGRPPADATDLRPRKFARITPAGMTALRRSTEALARTLGGLSLGVRFTTK